MSRHALIPEHHERATASPGAALAAGSGKRSGNKTVRILIMTVINVMLVNVRRVSVNERQRGSDGHA
jgi:hypothetical protein